VGVRGCLTDQNGGFWPGQNKKDVDFDVPQAVKDDVTFVYAERIEDVRPPLPRDPRPWAVVQAPGRSACHGRAVLVI
jgi:hypothetical protein